MKIRSLCMPAATLLVVGMVLVACMPVGEAVPREGGRPVDATQMLGEPLIPPIDSTEGTAQQAAPSPAPIDTRAEVGEPPIPPPPPRASAGDAVLVAEAPPRDQATPLPAPTDGNSMPDSSSMPPEVGTVESAPLDVPPQPPHDLPPATASPVSTNEPPASIAVDPTPGTLDTSFGDAGKVTTDFGGNTDWGYAIAVQADGKLVVAGHTEDDDLLNGDIAVARYNTDGSLDPSFGSGGLVITVLDYGWGFDLAIQPDGKIVVVGSGGIDGVWGWILVRYDEYGDLDPSFGDAGRVVADFDPLDGGAGLALVIQPDGKLVVAGENGDPSDFDFVVARFNPDGSLDAGFGTGGIVVTDFGAHDVSWGIGLQSDGKIVVAGNSYEYVGDDCDFALARYNTDGSLDTNFGTGGKVLTAFGTSEHHRGELAIQPDDKIIVVGERDLDFALVRYNPDGSLDATFGTDGKVTTDFNSDDDNGLAVALRADGKIIVSGESYTGSGADFALACYNPDGSLDTGFGAGGKVTTDFNTLDDRAFDVALQADGKIVAVGSTSDSQGWNFGLARYHAPASLPVNPPLVAEVVFAGAQGCSAIGLGVTGAEGLFSGDLHSNSSMHLASSEASPIEIFGDVSTVDTLSDKGIVYHGSVLEGADPRPFPELWQIQDFRPGGAWAVIADAHGEYQVITGDLTDISAYVSAGQVAPGIYYVTGDILLNAADLNGINAVGVTWVAEGMIVITPDNGSVYSPYDSASLPPMPLLFANVGDRTCLVNKGIQLSSSSLSLTGVLYAPNGLISLSLAGGAILNGAILGWIVDISASDFEINFAPTDIDTPPVVSIASPLDGSTVFGMVPIQVLAADDLDPAGTLTVEVSINGGLAWESAVWDDGLTYVYVWDTTSVLDGAYTLYARAIDSGMNVAMSGPVQVDVGNLGSISPAPGSQVAGITIEGSTVTVTVNGYLPDSCSRLGQIGQVRVNNRVEIWVYIQHPLDVFCLQVITPFEKVITLDGEFLPGDYVLVLNGVEYPFTVP